GQSYPESPTGADRSLARFTVKGSVREESFGLLDARYVSLHPARSFVLASWESVPDGRTLVMKALLRFDGEHWKHDAAESVLAPRNSAPVQIAVHGDDVWIVLADGSLWGESADGVVTARAIPEPIGLGKDGRSRYASGGGALAGVEQDDPWMVGRSGALYHLADGAWRKVELPRPPFSATATFRIDALVHTDDELLVNAGYVAKEPGWRLPEPHRAILRTKRPKETLRCNEPDVGWGPNETGSGFSSWPPAADDACATPFLVLVRKGMSQRLDGDHGTVRAILKGRVALGETAALVEFSNGVDRYLGMRVPSVAEGRGIAAALGKKVTARSEVVCGEVTPERTVLVDVATGEVRKPEPSTPGASQPNK
ncbi:MAG: hypothetical protein ACLQVI_16380, partial [Polyangiaceae bacterium]